MRINFMTAIVFIAFSCSVSVWGMGDEYHDHSTTPSSADAMPGKSVYLPPSASVDLREEARIQNEDQNTTGDGHRP